MDTDFVQATSPTREIQDGRARVALTAVLVGVVLAAWGVVADVIGYVDNPFVLVFLLGGNVPGPWVVGAFVVGAVAAGAGCRPVIAAMWSVTALLVADTLYYLGQLTVGSRSSTDAVASAAIAWGVAAVVAGVSLGAAGAVWARPHRHGADAGAIAIGVVAAVLLAEAVNVMPRDFDAVHLGRTAYAVLDIVAAVMLGRLVPRGSKARFAQTAVGLGVVGVLGAGWVLQVINAAIS